MKRIKRLKKYVALYSVLVIGLSSLAACDNKDKTGDTTESNTASSTDSASLADSYESSDIVMSVSGHEITKEEAMIYCLMKLLSGETTYSSIESNSEETEASIINYIAQTKKLYDMARNLDISFSEEDEQSRDELESNFKTNVSQDIRDRYGISDEMIKTVITEYAYVQKLEYATKASIYEQLLEANKEKYDGQKFQTLYLMVFPTVKVDENNEMVKDENGKNIALSDVEKAEVKKKLETAINEVKGGGVPEEVAEKYNVKEFSNGTAGIPGTYDASINDAVSALKSGECTDILENDICYYTVCMINDNDTEYKELYIEELANADVDTEYEKKKSEWLNESSYADTDFLGDFWESFDVIDMAKYLRDKGLLG